MENMDEDMRKRADWMKPIDDQILEILEDKPQFSSPAAIADEISRAPDYVGERCREMTEKGLIDRPRHGTYVLNTEGRRYLDGEFDASEL